MLSEIILKFKELQKNKINLRLNGKKNNKELRKIEKRQEKYMSQNTKNGKLLKRNHLTQKRSLLLFVSTLLVKIENSLKNKEDSLQKPLETLKRSGKEQNKKTLEEIEIENQRLWNQINSFQMQNLKNLWMRKISSLRNTLL